MLQIEIHSPDPEKEVSALIDSRTVELRFEKPLS